MWPFFSQPERIVDIHAFHQTDEQIERERLINKIAEDARHYLAVKQYGPYESALALLKELKS